MYALRFFYAIIYAYSVLIETYFLQTRTTLFTVNNRSYFLNVDIYKLIFERENSELLNFYVDTYINGPW